ncbi:MAG: transglutaminase domain-containing protein [bacterium]
MTLESDLTNLELPRTEFIKQSAYCCEVKIQGLNIPKQGENRYSIVYPLELRKVPMDRITPQTKEVDMSINIGDNDILRNLISEASKLKDIPVYERIHKIVEMTRSQLKYFDSSYKELFKSSDPEKYNWLIENVTNSYNGSLADVVEQGYGICANFTVLCAYLCQSAGLDVVLNTCGNPSPKNIIRSDTSKPIFRFSPLNEMVGGHTWLEVINGEELIPVDPTVNLVGTTPEIRAIFEESGYIDHLLTYSLLEDPLDNSDVRVDIRSRNITGGLVLKGSLIISNIGKLDLSEDLDLIIRTSSVTKRQVGALIIEDIGNPAFESNVAPDESSVTVILKENL